MQREREHPQTRVIFTIGHSNRQLGEFIKLLKENGIEQVIDIRRFPSSRKFPHFSGDHLAAALKEHGISYVHVGELGGRRSRVARESPNRGWRVEGFNAYADHLLSDEGQRALDAVERLASDRPSALLCAEAVPWRCHRQIVADHLVARGWTVYHVIGPGQVRKHKLPSFARVIADRQVVYPERDSQGELFSAHEEDDGRD